MAKLTTPLQVQSSFPQQAQQYAQTMQRNKIREQREQEKKEAEAKSEAKERGVLTAGVQGLQANPKLYAVGQQIYSDYMEAEESGDVESAESIKMQLNKFMTASAGFIRSEQNTLNGIINDPEKLSMFENNSSEIISAAENSVLGQYDIKMDGGQYVLADSSGNQFGLFNLPELTGEGSFMGQLTPKQKIPNYVNSTSFGEKHSRAILGRNDIVDKSGRITNPEGVVGYLSKEFDQEVRKNPDFLKGLVYDDQYVKGGLETFDEGAIDRLIEDEDYVRSLRDKYLETAVSTVNSYEDIKEIKEEKDKSDLLEVDSMPIFSMENGLNSVDFSARGNQVQYIREEGDQTIMTNIIRIGASEDGGLELYDNVAVDADNNPVIDMANAVAYRVKKRVVKPGDSEWNKITSVFGGQKYINALVKRLDPGLEM
jgi:hypothetical protein